MQSRRSALQRCDLDVTDLDELVALVRTIEAHDNPPYRTAPSEIEHWFTSVSPVRCAGWRFDDELVAYGQVRTRSMTPTEATCQGGVAPSWRGRGIGEATTLWQTAEATALLRERAGGTGRIVTHVEAENTEFENHLANLGYRRAESHYELTRPTTPAPAAVDLPGAIVLSPWRSELSDEVRRALNRMGETLGAAPLSADQWLDSLSSFLPEASLVAYDSSSDRSPIVGFLIASVYTQDWDAVGDRRGYIGMYGLDGDYQGRGIVRGLITRAVERFGELGMDSVAMSASDADVEALELLEDLGFAVTSTEYEYVLEVNAS